MLTAIRDADGRQVMARQDYRCHAPFRCPVCGSEVLIVKGGVRVHHFRHRPEARSCRAARESTQHLAAKASIDGFPVAIEIQRSAITIEEVTARTLRYRDHGVFVLWLSLLTEEHCYGEIAPCAWEQWAHAAYGGRVYYWVRDDEVQPIHYGPHHEKIAERRWVSRDRVQEVVPAHTRISKTCRTPEHGPRLSIARDFTPRRRPQFEGGKVHVPRCNLYVDGSPIWWTPRAT